MELFLLFCNKKIYIPYKNEIYIMENFYNKRIGVTFSLSLRFIPGTILLQNILLLHVLL